MSAVAISSEVETLIRESVACRLLSLAFERPREGWAGEIDALAAQHGDGAMLRLAKLVREQATEEVYLDILGPGGAVSPREVAYSGWADPGAQLASLTAMYDAFAYLPATEECADHLSVELGFLGYLRMKEAFARSAGDTDSAAVAADAARGFIAGHLGAFAHGLRAKSPESDEFYLVLAATLAAKMAGDAPARPFASGAGSLDDDTAITCGGDCAIE